MDKKPYSINDVIKALPILSQFIGNAQLKSFCDGIRGKDGQMIVDYLLGIVNCLKSIPELYETDSDDLNVLAYLHYNFKNEDWYITELGGSENGLQKCFGLYLSPDNKSKIDFINVQDLIERGISLDLYWEVCPLRKVLA